MTSDDALLQKLKDYYNRTERGGKAMTKLDEVGYEAYLASK